MKPHLVTAKPEHLAQLVSWIPDASACLIWGGPKLVFPLLPAEMPRQLETRLHAAYALVDEHATMLGFGQLIRKDAATMHLGRIIVGPDFRGQRLGQNLCKLLIKRATTQRGATRITLRVYPANVAAIRTYEHIGFRFVPEDPPDEAPLMQLFAGPGATTHSPVAACTP
jgi:RimJ/RimL family protein N-acetyltransferase